MEATDAKCYVRDVALEVLAKLAVSMRRSSGSAQLEGRMLKLARLVTYLEADKPALAATLEGMELFTRYVMSHFSGKDADMIADAIRGFLDHVKSQTAPKTGT